MNARKEKFDNATPLYQSVEDKPKEVDERLRDIEKKLDALVKPSARLKGSLPRKS